MCKKGIQASEMGRGQIRRGRKHQNKEDGTNQDVEENGNKHKGQD